MFAFASLLALLWATPALAQENVEPPRASEISLESWGTLVHVEDRQAPVVWVRLVFGLGSHHRTGQRLQLAQHWEFAVRAGLFLGRVPGEVRAWVSPTRSGIDLTVPSGDAREAIRVLADSLGEERFRFLNAKNPAKKRRKTALEHPVLLAGAAVQGVFIGAEDARRQAGLPPKGGRIDGAHLIFVRDTVLRADPVYMGFAGDVTAEEAQRFSDTLADALGSDRGRARAPEREELVPRAERPSSLQLTVPQSDEAVLMLATEGLGWEDEHAPAERVAAEAMRLSLQQLVREKRGDSYAIEVSGVSGSRWPYPITFLTMTAPRRSESHAAAVLAWMDGLAEEGCSEAMIERARARLLRKFEARRFHPRQRMTDGLAGVMQRRTQADLVEAIRGLSTADIQTEVRRLADPGKRLVVRVLPQRAVTPPEAVP